MQCSAVQCSAVQCSAVKGNAVQCSGVTARAVAQCSELVSWAGAIKVSSCRNLEVSLCALHCADTVLLHQRETDVMVRGNVSTRCNGILTKPHTSIIRGSDIYIIIIYSLTMDILQAQVRLYVLPHVRFFAPDHIWQ